MIILMSFVVLLLISFILAKVSYDKDWEIAEIFGISGSVITSIVVFVVLIIWPITYYHDGARIKKYYAIKKTVESYRKRQIDLEKVGMWKEIMELNKLLASTKFYNTPMWFGYWTQDEYANLPIIE